MRGKPFPQRAVSIVSHIPLQDLTATCDHQVASVDIVRPEGALGTWQLLIKPSERLPAGPFEFGIAIHAVATSGNSRAIKSAIAVKGFVAEPIQLTPRGLLFGAAPVGTELRGDVTIHSMDGTPFTVGAIDASSSAVTVEAKGQAADKTAFHFVIKRQVTQLGNHSDVVTFTALTESRAFALPLSLSYYGVSAPTSQ